MSFKYCFVNNKYIDLSGQKFGRYTVLRLSDGREQGGMVWLCKCECGTEKTQSSAELIHRGVVSCGCYQKEIRGASKITHGATRNGVKSSEYRCYIGMKGRCSNPNNPCAHLYIGKGVTVCDRWLGVEGFKNFMEDMGPRPSLQHSLDRIDGNGNYCPENCRWATRKQQGRNVSTNRRIEIDGITKCLSEWAEFLGIEYYTLHRRVRTHEKHRMSVESAITNVRDGIKFVPPVIAQGFYIEARGKKLTQIEWARELGITKNAMYGRIANRRKHGLPIESAIC